MKNLKTFEQLNESNKFAKAWEELYKVSKASKEEILKSLQANGINPDLAIPYGEMNSIHVAEIAGKQTDADENVDLIYVLLNPKEAGSEEWQKSSNEPSEILPNDIMYSFEDQKDIDAGNPLMGASLTAEKARRKEWDVKF